MGGKRLTIGVGRVVFFVLFFALLTLGSLSLVSANNHSVVGNTFSGIQDVVDNDAVSGDSIVLDNITYFGSGSYIRVNKSLTIQGESKDKYATLDARNLSRIILVTNASLVTFKYITFINGDSTAPATGGVAGGAIRSNSNLYISDCVFKNNFGGSGGAVFITDSTGSTVINTLFIDNRSDLDDEDTYTEGGGLDIHGSNSLVINCTFINNSAGSSGGALSIVLGTGNQIINCTFTNNSALLGGAIRFSSVTVVLEWCNFTDNSADEVGGGIFIQNSIANVISGIFINNRAPLGGAIYATSNADMVKISASTFNGNQANNGGALYILCDLELTGSNFTANRAGAGNTSGVYSTSAILIQNNNFRNNIGIALTLMGQSTRIIGNNFTSNVGIVIRVTGNNVIISENNFINNSGNVIQSESLNNVLIIRNLFKDNGGIGILITGSNVRIHNNNFINNRFGINITGNKADISNNNISNSVFDGISLAGNDGKIINNKLFRNGRYGILLRGSNGELSKNSITYNGNYGLYIVGRNSKIISNNIENNNQGIYIKGNNQTLNKNVIFKNKGHGINLDSNNTKITNNKINNNQIGIKFKGKKNSLAKNIINSNTKSGLIFTGNQNTIKNNNLTHNRDKSIDFSGSKNNIFGNVISNSKYGIISKKDNNKIYNNIIKSNSIGFVVQGNGNSIYTNTIMNNNHGVKHNSGKNNCINYNYIVNKKINLQRLKGTLNAEYNWWGANKVDNVKNQKVSRYVIVKLISPKISYLKSNTTYKHYLNLHDDRSRKLKKTIPSMIAQSSLTTKINNKNSQSLISTKKVNFSKNRLGIDIKIVNERGSHSFVSKIDKQKISLVFNPPADLDIGVISYSSPANSNFVITYQIKVKNLGNFDAKNVTLKSNIPKFTRAVYSFDGLKWKKFNKSMSINQIKKNSEKTIYIRGQLKNKFKGKFNTTFSVKTSTVESNYGSNKYKIPVKVDTKKHYSHCGLLVLEIFLFNNAKNANIEKLIEDLNNNQSGGSFDDMINVIEKQGINLKGGVSFYDMIQVTEKFDINLKGVSLSFDKLKSNDIALIKLKKETHYVLITQVSKNYVRFVDPLLGPVILTKSDFKLLYTGKALTTRNSGKQLSLKTLKITKGLTGNVVVDPNVVRYIGSISITGPQGAALAGIGIVGYVGSVAAINWAKNLPHKGGSTPMKGNYDPLNPFKGVTNLKTYSNPNYYSYNYNGRNYVTPKNDLKKIEKDSLEYFLKEARKIAKGNKGNLKNAARWLPYLTGAGLLDSNSAEVVSKVTMILLMGEIAIMHDVTKNNPNPDGDIGHKGTKSFQNQQPQQNKPVKPINDGDRGSPDGPTPLWQKILVLIIAIGIPIGITLLIRDGTFDRI